MDKGVILIIEDSKTLHNRISEIIRNNGYITTSSFSGKEALKILEMDDPPDLIILDIVLPELSGFEIFKKLKSMDHVKNVPVIFLTGLSDTENLRHGLELGAIDYILKPFSEVELLLKINNHFKYIDLKKKLQEKKKSLLELNRTKSTILSILSHDLRTPFSALIGLTELIKNHDIDRSDFDFNAGIKQLNEISVNTYNQLENLLKWSALQNEQLKPIKANVNFKDLIIEENKILKEIAKIKGVKLIDETKDNLSISTDPEMLKTIIRNLISNAIKYSHPNSSVKLSSTIGKKSFQFNVEDNGVGMTESEIQSISSNSHMQSKFGTKNEKGAGLGLKLCKQLSDVIQYKLTVSSVLNKGTTFTLEIPIK